VLALLLKDRLALFNQSLPLRLPVDDQIIIAVFSVLAVGGSRSQISQLSFASLDATMADESEYLAPGFDPSSITVPKLRGILTKHEIPFPSSAKKPELIETFNSQIAPKAGRLRGAQKRVQRTSMGIEDMPSSQEGTIVGDDERDLMPPPPVPQTSPRKRSSKKSLVEPSPTKKTPSKRTNSKHARASDTETGTSADELQKSVRKTRKSEGPKIKVEEPLETPIRRLLANDNSAFSSDNPFQSGSSPLDGMDSTSGERRRKSMPAKDTPRKKSSSSRRRTDFTPKSEEDGIVPKSTKFEYSQKDSDHDSGFAGEEFTPEERMELARERAMNGESMVVAPRRKKRQSSGALKTAPWAVLFTLLMGYATFWYREKLEIGYCNVGSSSNALLAQIPDWAEFLIPECEPCPQHAICYPNLRTKCEDDFIVKQHPLSLGGLVPLAPTCEPDGEKVRRVKQVADRAIEELRERRAKFECGELKSTPVEMPEEELKQTMAAKRRKDMSREQFEDLWRGAIGEIQGREEVVLGGDG
jgi:Man1-Src1p-C-terminal domain/HeH/LEM domain